MRIRTPALIAIAVLLAGAGVALARPHPSIDFGLTSARAGAPARVTVRANLGGAVNGTLMSYEVDLARGFAFDARAVPAVCRERALRQDNCPVSSRIGMGTGRIAVQGRYLPRTEYPVNASLYLTAPRDRGDLAGVLLDLDQQQSALQVALPGSVVVAHGRYGLGLRFADTARELPSGYHLTVPDLDLEVGATTLVSGRLRSLLTNPSVCPSGGWPIAVSVQSGRVRGAFATRTRCY